MCHGSNSISIEIEDPEEKLLYSGKSIILVKEYLEQIPAEEFKAHKRINYL